jgi:Tfp pilus assembly PilM family ATPase
MRLSNFSVSKRRCIAVDLGQSRIKAILAERKGHRIDVLHAFTLDLQEEGLLTQEETNRHISRILLEMGEYPVSMVIPQHLTVSHLIALPAESRARWGRLIEEETQKLIGLSESAIVYDYFRLRPFQRYRNPVWVTVSREKELEDQIRRLRGSDLEIAEVTNAGNALASAYLATQPPEKRVVLADIGATATTVVILERMQPVYATTFPYGGELFTEAIAGARGRPFDEAEVLKKTELCFAAEEPCPEFLQAVERWQQEVEKVIGDWTRDQPEVSEQPLKVALSGGSSLQPGFVDFLGARSPFHYVTWRDSAGGVDPQTYAVAYGAALAGLKVAPVSSSLLPRPLRVQRLRTLQVTALNTVALLFLVALFAVFLADSSAKRRAIAQKGAWVADLQAALARTDTIEELLAERSAEYNKIVPVVQQQQRTRDLLQTISLMQRVRAEHEVWFVALADGRSYFNEATVTPAVSGASGRGSTPRGSSRPVDGGSASSEASPAGWNRFVVELSIPGDPRAAHESLRSVVSILSSANIFRNVDTLPAAARREIANPAVALPDQTFSLNLELIPGELPLPVDETRRGPLLNR